MTDRQPEREQLRPDAVVPREGAQSGWVGMVIFAGIVMILLGAFNVIDGIVALVNHEWFVTAENDLLAFNYTAWGWFWLLFGLVTIFAGFGVLAGQTWARVVGIVVAVLNAVGHMVFVSAHPVWSVMIIALDVLVIYALTAHGRELGQEGPVRG